MSTEVCEQECETKCEPKIALDSLSIAELDALIKKNDEHHKVSQKNLRAYLKVRQDMGQ